MEFNVELHWDHIIIGLLQEHCRFIVDNVGLTSFVVPKHKIWMFFSDQSRHKCLDSKILNILLAPLKKLSQSIIHLNKLPKTRRISIYNHEISVVGVFFIGKVFLIDLVDLEDASHFSYIQFVSLRIIQNMQLNNGKLEVHLIVFEYFECIQLLKHSEYLLYICGDTCSQARCDADIDRRAVKCPPKRDDLRA